MHHPIKTNPSDVPYLARRPRRRSAWLKVMVRFVGQVGRWAGRALGRWEGEPPGSGCRQDFRAVQRARATRRTLDESGYGERRRGCRQDFRRRDVQLRRSDAIVPSRAPPRPPINASFLPSPVADVVKTSGRCGVQGRPPELLTSPATRKGVADVVKTSGRGRVQGRPPELLTSPATRKGVADVVKTSDGAACKGDAPNS